MRGEYKVPGGKLVAVDVETAEGVISSGAEVFDGCLVWPFTLRLPALGGVQEVFVDAGDGRVVKSDFIRLGPRPAGAP